MKTIIKRQSVTPSVAELPTVNTLTMLPMTVDRVGTDASPIDAAVEVRSIDDAFAAFGPAVAFAHEVGDETFEADLEFTSLRSFSPDAILKGESTRRGEDGQRGRNDLADLQGKIEFVQFLRSRFAQKKVGDAWRGGNAAELIAAFQEFQDQVRLIAAGDERGNA